MLAPLPWRGVWIQHLTWPRPAPGRMPVGGVRSRRPSPLAVARAAAMSCVATGLKTTS